MRTLIIKEREAIEAIIRSCKTCFVALSVDDKPYLLPMNFALDGDAVILHSAQSGRFWESIRKNPGVCINWTIGEELAWQDVRVGCSYRVKSQSVLVEGSAVIVEEFNEKERCLHLLMAQYSDRTFGFNAPAVKNVGILRVSIGSLSARAFGVPVNDRFS